MMPAFTAYPFRLRVLCRCGAERHIHTPSDIDSCDGKDCCFPDQPHDDDMLVRASFSYDCPACGKTVKVCVGLMSVMSFIQTDAGKADSITSMASDIEDDLTGNKWKSPHKMWKN